MYIGHLVFPWTLHLCFIFLLSVFNLTFFYFIFFSGEGCPADHGPEFKAVKGSWVCA